LLVNMSCDRNMNDIEEQELALTRDLASIDEKIQQRQPDLKQLERCLTRALDALKPEEQLHSIRSEIVLLSEGLGKAQLQIQDLRGWFCPTE